MCTSMRYMQLESLHHMTIILYKREIAYLVGILSEQKEKSLGLLKQVLERACKNPAGQVKNGAHLPCGASGLTG